MSSRSRRCFAIVTFATLLSLILAVAWVRFSASTDQSLPPNEPRRPLNMPLGLEKLDHFVFIMQENRSFDHYFGTYPGADGIPEGVCLPDPANNECVSPFHD